MLPAQDHPIRFDKFAKAFNLAPLYLAISSLETGKLVEVNDAFVELSGYTRDQAVGRTTLELGLWVDPAEREKGLERLKQDGAVREQEAQLRLKDGEVRTFLISAEVADLDGERCVLSSAVDITERKLAEAEQAESDQRYRTLFNATDEGFCVIEVLFDPEDEALDYRFLETNPRFEDQTGLVDAVGKTARELVPNLEPHWFEIYGQVALTGEARRFEDGSDEMGRWFDVYAFRIGGAESRKVGVLFKDISKRRQADARLRFLASASELLAASPDVQGTLEQLAGLAVPTWADWCVVSLLDPGGAIRPAAVAHKDPEKIRWAKELLERYPADPDAAVGSANVIRTGRPELYTEVTDEMLRAAARDEAHLRLLMQVRYRSAVIVPLSAYGTTLGALSLVRETGQAYAEVDMRFAEELGARAATAIENAHLFEANSAVRRDLALLNETLEQRVRERTSQVRDLAGQLTLAEARERARLAQVLHDDLQQQLFAVQFALRDARRLASEQPDLLAKLEEANELVKGTLKTSRTTTANLAPPVLEGEGLVEAVQWLGNDMKQRYNLEVTVIPAVTPEVMSKSVRFLLFNLIRELLFNVVKHAEVDAAVVTLADNKGLEIEVSDHGKGFDLAAVKENQVGTGLGLSGMRQRLDLFGGRLEVVSSAMAGTRVTIFMPPASLSLE